MICKYCGGDANSGCGAIRPEIDQHYSKIDCAEVLKRENERLSREFDKISGAAINRENRLAAVLIQIETLKKIVERIEWRNYGPADVHCPWCSMAKHVGHDDGCAVGNVLKDRQAESRKGEGDGKA